MSNVKDDKLLDEVRENTKKIKEKFQKNESIIFWKEKKILIRN